MCGQWCLGIEGEGCLEGLNGRFIVAGGRFLGSIVDGVLRNLGTTGAPQRLLRMQKDLMLLLNQGLP